MKNPDTESQREPVAPVGKLIGAPSLPAHYLAHHDSVNAMCEALRSGLDERDAHNAAPPFVGLHGMGGIGKSVLANAVAREPEIRRTFPDGIYWLAVGQSPRVTDLQLWLARQLGDEGWLSGGSAGRERLRDLLTDRAVLLILDDVWQREHAEAFDVVGPRGRVLLTTRDSGLVTALAVRETHFQVQLPTPADAEALLAAAAHCEPSALSPEARMVAAECGRLPLALAVCGGMVQGGTPWRDVLDALREDDLEFLSSDHPAEEHHRSVWKAMDVSLRILPEEQRQRFVELAVFGTDVAVPEAAVTTLWGHTGGFTPRHARKLLVDLARRSLVQLLPPAEGDPAGARVELHDLVASFADGMAVRRFGLRAAMDRLLLEAYRAKCPDGWSDGPEDGYFFRNVFRHLTAATGNWDEATDLLCDPRYLEGRCRQGQVHELPGALAAAGIRPPPDQQAVQDALLQAIRKEAENLLSLPHLVAPLLGSCLAARALPSAVMDRFLARLDAHYLGRHPLLLRERGLPASDPFVGVLESRSGPSTAVTVLPDGETIVCGDSRGRVTVFDARTLRPRAHAQTDLERIDRCACSGSGAVVVSWNADGRKVALGTDTLRPVAWEDGFDGLLGIGLEALTSLALEEAKRLDTFKVRVGFFGGSSQGIYEDPAVQACGTGRTVAAVRIAGYIFPADNHGQVQVWESAGPRLLKVFPVVHGFPSRCAISADGRYAGCCTEHGVVKVWDVETGTPVADFKVADKAVDFAVGGRTIVVHRAARLPEVWQWSEQDAGRATPDYAVRLASVSASGDVVATCGDYRLSVWEFGRTYPTWTHEFEREHGEFDALEVSADGRRVIATYGYQDWRYTEEGDVVIRVEVFSAEGEPVTGCGDVGPDAWFCAFAVFLGDDGQEAVAGGTELKHLTATGIRTLGKNPFPGAGHAVRLPDTATLFLASDLELCLYDVLGDRVLRRFPAHPASLISVGVSNSGKTGLSLDHPGGARLWDLTTGELLREAQLESSPLGACLVLDDGSALAVQALDRVLRVTDVQTGATRGEYAFRGRITAVAANRDATRFVVGAGDGRPHYLEVVAPPPAADPVPTPVSQPDLSTANRRTSPIQLDGPDQLKLSDAIQSAFPKVEDLETVLLHLNDNLSNYSGQGFTYPEVRRKLISSYNARNEVEHLVSALLNENPTNAKLLEFAARHQILKAPGGTSRPPVPEE